MTDLDPLARRTARKFLSQQEEDEEVVAVAPPGWEGPVKDMKKDKDIDNPWALAWYMKNKGDKPHKEASLVERVAARFLRATEPVAMEHDSPEALKKYLHEHPGADPKNHTVKKEHSEGGGKSDGPSMKEHVGHLAKSLKQQADHVFKMGDQAKKLESALDKATGYKGDKEKAKAVAEKFNQAHYSALSSANVTLIHGQSVINIAKKHGAGAKVISKVEEDLQYVTKLVKEMKEGDKPLTGESHEMLHARTKAKNMNELAHRMQGLNAAVSLLTA